MNENELRERLTSTAVQVVANAETTTPYRTPLVAFASAADPRFRDLKKHVGPPHMLPGDLLEGAETVLSFFVPFAESVVEANRVRKSRVATEWAIAYLETNALIADVCERLDAVLKVAGHSSAAPPATGNFDRETLESWWSHKSAAVIAGLGRLGLHHMLITEAGCAGRLGSLVTDARIEPTRRRLKELCLQFGGATCADCVSLCPVGALNGAGGLNRQLCWTRCHAVAQRFEELGTAEVCGKCAMGRCSLEVPKRGQRS